METIIDLKRKLCEMHYRLNATKKGSKCYNDTLRAIRKLERKIVERGLTFKEEDYENN